MKSSQHTDVPFVSHHVLGSSKGGMAVGIVAAEVFVHLRVKGDIE